MTDVKSYIPVSAGCERFLARVTAGGFREAMGRVAGQGGLQARLELSLGEWKRPVKMGRSRKGPEGRGQA